MICFMLAITFVLSDSYQLFVPPFLQEKTDEFIILWLTFPHFKCFPFLISQYFLEFVKASC